MYRGSISVEHLRRNLRHHSVRALAHVDRANIEAAASVAVQVDDRNGGRGRRDTLETNRNAASSANAAVPAVKGYMPIHPDHELIEHRIERGVAHKGAARLRASVAQQILAAEPDFVDAQRLRDHVHVALVGPGCLRRAKAA